MQANSLIIRARVWSPLQARSMASIKEKVRRPAILGSSHHDAAFWASVRASFTGFHKLLGPLVDGSICSYSMASRKPPKCQLSHFELTSCL